MLPESVTKGFPTPFYPHCRGPQAMRKRHFADACVYRCPTCGGGVVGPDEPGLRALLLERDPSWTLNLHCECCRHPVPIHRETVDAFLETRL